MIERIRDRADVPTHTHTLRGELNVIYGWRIIANVELDHDEPCPPHVTHKSEREALDRPPKRTSAQLGKYLSLVSAINSPTKMLQMLISPGFRNVHVPYRGRFKN
jgi:hypothetical protein